MSVWPAVITNIVEKLLSGGIAPNANKGHTVQDIIQKQPASAQKQDSFPIWSNAPLVPPTTVNKVPAAFPEAASAILNGWGKILFLYCFEQSLLCSALTMEVAGAAAGAYESAEVVCGTALAEAVSTVWLTQDAAMQRKTSLI